MKVFSTLKQSSFHLNRPQEDFFAISKKYPIYVVADGVTLNFDDENYYPKESGAGDVADIFCKSVILEAEKRFEDFSEKDLSEVFDVGNKAVAEYNKSCKITKENINYWNIDLFSATTSFLLMKDGKAFWWSLCDSGVAVFNKTGKKVFCSANNWDAITKLASGIITEKEKVISLHRDFRNNPSGVGYGVTTGEETAKLYLSTGTLEVGEGDVIFVYTDGYENHVVLNDFVKIFTTWPKDVKKEFDLFDEKMAKETPSKFARERTLIAVLTEK